MIIAIDGPAGSGKSTVAKRVAQELGFEYLDTGAMYRAVGVRALEESVPFSDEAAVAAIATSERISFAHEPGASLASRVFIGSEDVTEAIRTPAADEASSAVSRLPRVREAMVDRQREIGAERDIVVEGRDIGTVVFPDAKVKIFLTASAEERARRRALEHIDRGHRVEQEEVADAMAKRDEADSTREASPLAMASDAVELDTTGLSIDDVVAQIVSIARSRR